MTVSKSLQSESLDGLENQDARKIMDVVDGLRKAGLSGIIQLPQIVTCGDQSSGKSSVLEAITGIPFPRKENLCTRFATQIVLRRASTESVSVTIFPDKLRPDSEREKLEKIRLTLDNFNKLDKVMAKATDAMGLTETGGDNPRAFSRDVLNIEISGPDRPHLTLVDLPGLIHSHNKQASEDDVKLINSMVNEYILEKRTIVLAVVSAKNDSNNQIILKNARDLGAADRNLGVITKPDFLEAGSSNEQDWITLAQNKDVVFGLGWHMLRNRSEKEMTKTLDERDQNEKFFFSSGTYRQLDRDNVCIDPLRKRLSTLLYKHLKGELPSLQNELNEKYKETEEDLVKLGQARSTPKEQKNYLMQLGNIFERVAESAADGYYRDHFFSTVDVSQAVDHPANAARLRAIVQYANLQFSHQMKQYGAKYKITDQPEELRALQEDGEPDIELDESFEQSKPIQKIQTHKEAVKWVQDVLERSRGRELPGNFNPLIISELFWDQSRFWEQLASAHVDRVAAYCARFVKNLLKSATPDDVYEKILLHKIEPALKRRRETAHIKLAEILEDKQNDPITYNHYYTSTIQKMRIQKQNRLMENITKDKQHYMQGFSGTKPAITMDALTAALAGAGLEQDMMKFSAEDALTCQMAYYKDEMKYFVNCVTKQVIERCLIKNLATDLVSAPDFGNMTDEQVSALAAEPSSISQERERLQKRKATLEEGKNHFKATLGGF